MLKLIVDNTRGRRAARRPEPALEHMSYPQALAALRAAEDEDADLARPPRLSPPP